MPPKHRRWRLCMRALSWHEQQLLAHPPRLDSFTCLRFQRGNL